MSPLTSSPVHSTHLHNLPSGTKGEREGEGTRRKVGDEHQDEAASGGTILNFWFGELLSNHEHCKIWSQVQQCKVQTKYNDQVQTTEAPRSTTATASRQMPVGRSLLLVWVVQQARRGRGRDGDEEDKLWRSKVTHQQTSGAMFLSMFCKSRTLYVKMENDLGFFRVHILGMKQFSEVE